jgi:hypothetical protein
MALATSAATITASCDLERYSCQVGVMDCYGQVLWAAMEPQLAASTGRGRGQDLGEEQEDVCAVVAVSVYHAKERTEHIRPT